MIAEIRRAPAAIIAACRMDPQRRELYVEGLSDRLFLQWITEGQRARSSKIIEAQFVDSPNVPGGERGRLLALAAALESANVPVRVLVDTDWDEVLGVSYPENVYLTDGCDMENYFLREDCFEKIVSLALKLDDINGSDLLNLILKKARQIGLLRLFSCVKDLRLPFQKTDLARYASMKKGQLEYDYDRLITVLMQGANISLRERPSLKAELDELSKSYSATPDDRLAHGKDVVMLLDVYSHGRGVKGNVGETMLWSTFERALVAHYSNLSRVVGFLQGDLPIP